MGRLKTRTNRCSFRTLNAERHWRSGFSVLKLHLFVLVFSLFIPIRTSLELQNLFSFCYFSIFKIPSCGYGLSAGAVYKGTFTMLVIKLKCRARCAGFELDLRTKNSRSQKFFLMNHKLRPKVELNRDVTLSLGGTWQVEIFNLKKITLVSSAILHG